MRHEHNFAAKTGAHQSEAGRHTALFSMLRRNPGVVGDSRITRVAPARRTEIQMSDEDMAAFRDAVSATLYPRS